MNIFIPSPLRSYTQNKSKVEGTGGTMSELLEDLDRKFPGIRFRMVDEQDQIRTHIKIFVNREQATTLATVLQAKDEVLIICALSGG